MSPQPPTGWHGCRFSLVRRHRTRTGAGKTTTIRLPQRIEFYIFPITHGYDADIGMPVWSDKPEPA
jgi:hypothetical protein